MTTSLAIASTIHAYSNIELVLLGGNVRHHTPDLCGPLTEANLRQFQTDLAILGGEHKPAGKARTAEDGDHLLNFGVAAGKCFGLAVEGCVTQIELVDEPSQLLLVAE